VGVTRPSRYPIVPRSLAAVNPEFLGKTVENPAQASCQGTCKEPRDKVNKLSIKLIPDSQCLISNVQCSFTYRSGIAPRLQ
jgi:hypothetical protein